MACTCQKCGKQYKMDLIIQDDLWGQITPSKDKEGGLLCPSCIVKAIESLLGYCKFELK